MKRIVLISGLYVMNLITVIGQDTLAIREDQVITRIHENNYDIKGAEIQAEIAAKDFQSSNELYLPRLSASYTAITTNNPLMAFGSKLNQEVLTAADFDPSLLNNPDRVQNYATEILVLQPLLNLDGMYGRNAARIQKEAYQLKAGRTKEYLELEAIKWYMQLQLAYEAVLVLERALATSNEALSMVKDYYDQGMLQKADVLDVEVRKNEVQNQLQYAKTNVANVSDQLAVLMGEEPGVQVFRPEQRAANAYETMQLNLDLPEGRKDLLAMGKSVEGYEQMLRSSKMKSLPRINAFGSFQLYDNQFMSFNASGYVLGAKLTWDLFNGYSNIAQVNKARLQSRKAEVEQQEYVAQQQAELNKANRMLIDSENKVQLAELALKQSNEVNRARRDRFEQGLETTTELLNAETKMYQKELELRQAIFEYNFSKAYLHFLTRQ